MALMIPALALRGWPCDVEGDGLKFRGFLRATCSTSLCLGFGISGLGFRFKVWGLVFGGVHSRIWGFQLTVSLRESV